MNRCRVVLVRPHIAANLGATARVMHNFGIAGLVLVAPVADPTDREARKLSTHGEHILDQCRIVPALDDAVADCVFVAATSARMGGLFRDHSSGSPDEVMTRLVDALASGPAALVFGPEPSGLTNAEVSRCHTLLHIRTDPAYPALNLAQAVAICLYQLRCEWLRRTEPAVAPPVLAPYPDQERMFANLQSALAEVHFLFGDKADALWHGIRHLLARAGLTPMEVQLLHGLARQLHWFADPNRPRPMPTDNCHNPQNPSASE